MTVDHLDPSSRYGPVKTGVLASLGYLVTALVIAAGVLTITGWMRWKAMQRRKRQ